MLREVSYYETTFNARWMKPELVAEDFVPTQEFQNLIHSTHSVLLGPRGCGKTTLLKMLTRRALDTWNLKRKPYYAKHVPFDMPAFESIYIPSDVRWMSEIKSIKEELPDSSMAERFQRILVSVSVLIAFIDSMEYILGNSIEQEIDLCTMLIRHFELVCRTPNYVDIKSTLYKINSDVQEALKIKDLKTLELTSKDLAPKLCGHALDVPTQCCALTSELFKGKLAFDRWALCYDELEIAPEWLQKELIQSTRSLGEQNILLKLTWSPFLPGGAGSEPQVRHDFVTIRLWHSHVGDATVFCRNLADSFLKRKFDDGTVTANSFFSPSSVIHDEKDRSIKPYERGSEIYLSIKELAGFDDSFADFLRSHHLDPDDPYTESSNIRNTVLRKIAPIVMLRLAFTKPSGFRSRKVKTIYFGENAIYFISEANPRILLGILNDLYDTWKVRPTFSGPNKYPHISPNVQARVLSEVANRFHTYLSTVLVDLKQFGVNENMSLITFIDLIGNHLNKEMLTKSPFPINPVGSFTVEDNPSDFVVNTVDKAVNLGALVFVGASQQDVPVSVAGQRFRLSFLLAPVFKLPLRNYNPIKLGQFRDRKLAPRVKKNRGDSQHPLL